MKCYESDNKIEIVTKKQRPTIKTERLTLRPITREDLPELQRLASDRDIASTTNIEIPKLNMENQWFQERQEAFEEREAVDFAVFHHGSGVLIGAIGLSAEYKKDGSMQLGYWIGRPYWNQGYCTEAAEAVVKYGFVVFGLHRIHARHFTRNPASGRIMQKVGMKYEGTLREAFEKWGKFEDVECYGILKSECDKSK